MVLDAKGMPRSVDSRPEKILFSDRNRHLLCNKFGIIWKKGAFLVWVLLLPMRKDPLDEEEI